MGFRRGTFEDKFAFFEASKNPTPKRRKLLAKCPFFQAKSALFETSFKVDRVSFSTPEIKGANAHPCNWRGGPAKGLDLGGMFHCNASLPILHLKSFAAIPSMSLVQLGHTNRNVLANILAFVSQGLCFWRFAGRWHRTIRIRSQIAARSHDTMPLRMALT